MQQAMDAAQKVAETVNPLVGAHRPQSLHCWRWLREAGFSQVRSTHSGSWFAGQLFNQLPEPERPSGLPGLDNLLRPLIPIVVELNEICAVPWPERYGVFADAGMASSTARSSRSANVASRAASASPSGRSRAT